MFLDLMQFLKACKMRFHLEYKFKLNVSTKKKNRMDFNVTLNLKTSAKWRVRKAIVTEGLSYSFILRPICHNKPDLYYTSIWSGSLCGLQLISPIHSTYISVVLNVILKEHHYIHFALLEKTVFIEKEFERVFLEKITLTFYFVDAIWIMISFLFLNAWKAAWMCIWKLLYLYNKCYSGRWTNVIADVCNYGAIKVYNIEMQKRSTLGEG